MQDLSPWGFSRDIQVNVSLEGVPDVLHLSDSARVRQTVIYASIRDEGLPLKIGITRRSLWQRWSGTIRVIGAEKERIKLRDNEWNDRDCWRHHVLGRSFDVWSKPTESVRIQYTKDLPAYKAAIAEAEEEYLDALLEPVIGKSLRLRGKL